MLEAARAFMVRTTDWRSPALLIFRRRLAVGVAHDFSSGAALVLGLVCVRDSGFDPVSDWVRLRVRIPAWVEKGRVIGGRFR